MRWKPLKNEKFALLAVVAILLIAWFAGAFASFGVPSPFSTTTILGPTATPTPPSGMVNVEKQLKITVTDKHGGAGATGTTDSINIYKADGKSAYETNLDLSSATVTSALTYKSGTVVWIRYYYDTAIDEYMWWQVTVPQMAAVDAQQAGTIPIQLEAFSTNSYTDSLTHSNGTAITDGAVLNVTQATTGTLTYAWYGATDNCGFIASHDPVYDIDLKAQVWIVITGTNYETVTLTGMDGKIAAGATHYYYKTVNPDLLTVYKVGNNYILTGSGSVAFGYSATGYSGAAATIQIYLKIYSNEDYFQDNVDYGPYDFSCEEQTVVVRV